MSEGEKMAEIPEASFAGVVLFFATIASQHLGVVKNPLTEKIEKDLNLAKYTIDSLEIIQKKTLGNLAEDEKNLLENILSELKLAYVRAQSTQDGQSNPKEA